jgi:hypothetical protein
MNPENLGDFLMNHKWVAVASLIVWAVVRMLKSDTKIPLDIPPRVRAIAALVLGAVAGALDKLLANGEPRWQDALWNGLAAGAGAIVFHCLFVDTLLGGKELPVPGLTKPGVPPAPGKPPSIPPVAQGVVLALLLSVGAAACGYGKPACAVVDVAKSNCDLWIRYLAEDGSVREIQIPKDEATQLARTTAKKRAADGQRDGGAP